MVRLLIFTFILGCGSDYTGINRTKDVADDSCTVNSTTEGAVITCPDGSKATIQHGQDGQDGQDGVAGKDGISCTITELENGAEISCDDGETVVITNGTNGKDGQDGQDGVAGKDGIDGKDGQEGAKGEQGEQGEKGEKGEPGKIVNARPVYVGYYCSRVVLLISNIHYIIHGQLIPLTKDWLKVSNSCKVRYKNKTVEQKDV